MIMQYQTFQTNLNFHRLFVYENANFENNVDLLKNKIKESTVWTKYKTLTDKE